MCPTSCGSKSPLKGLVLGRSLSCEKMGQTYGRTAAFCQRADGIDLSCAMVESGTAAKWDRYWGWHSC